MREPTLHDRYRFESGLVYLTGLQALVRLPIDQQRRDRRAGLKTATFISGYPGSPLAGYDLALRSAGDILDEHDILHVPGANEELAATAISGTQMLDGYPHSRVDGVTALWYGKGPGIDRSGDALKHGNFAGTSRHGAVVILSGEDHEAKSSTMPFQEDYAFLSAGIPVLYPASPAEFLTLGLHAVAMSRYSGCWVAMKLVSALADGGQTVVVDADEPKIATPELEINGRPFAKSTDFAFFPGANIETERRLYYERHRAVVAYARANRIDGTVCSAPGDRIGIITAGKSDADTRQALLDMALDLPALARLGVRVLRLGLIYPIDAETIREFARDLNEVIVIEEKRGFIESQVKDALNALPRSVRVIGKFNEAGAPLFPIHGGLDADLIAERLGRRLLEGGSGSLATRGIRARLEEIAAVRARRYGALPMRTPNYCSGCPHNISTRLLEGDVAWGSPGCHCFASIIEQPERHIVSMTQLGGEGLPWIGLAPFTDRRHIVQNVGDGSLFHSSYLNIRFCAVAGVNITFKILYNGSVANTGAQAAVGAKSIPELTRLLELEGVKWTALLTQDPSAYRRSTLASNVRVYGVDEQESALKALSAETGVTVLIYDGRCANERRRQQKRGQIAAPNRFVVINQRVCEGCGHCGALTNCMSLHNVQTELGEKTEIHRSSCNQDDSCLDGDCPAFVTVETKPGTGYRRPSAPLLADTEIAEPRARVNTAQPFRVYIPGVGGTGVITLNALLCHAALIEGKRVLSYDQTGAAQKWGPVLSSVVIADDERGLASNQVPAGGADLYLACDLMAASAPAHLDRCDSRRTAAILNTSVLPSGESVRQTGLSMPVAAMIQAIARQTDPDRTIEVEARRLAEALFGDYMAANIIALGVACQAGLVPLAPHSIEAAIRLNGVQVDQNIQAFRYGRLFGADRRRVLDLVDVPRRDAAAEATAILPRLTSAERVAYTHLLERCRGMDDESQRMLAIRVGDLIQYQDASYAAAYVDFVLSVSARERRAIDGGFDITRQAVRHLYKLMAYKDEYEVARLHVAPEMQAETSSLFEAPGRVVHHLHPPMLRALGLRRKLALGPWFTPVLRALARLRRLRGTPFDVFGYAAVRREERALIEWYRGALETALAGLSGDTYAAAVEIAALPDRIRGYEEIKLKNAAAARRRASEITAGLAAIASS